MSGFVDLLNLDSFGPADLVEVLVVAFLLYKFLRLIQRTRAVQALVGVVLLLGAYWLAERLRFSLLHWILTQVMIVLPLAIVIVFQNTIRRAFANFGRNPFWRRWGAGEADALIDEVVLASSTLASQRTGALIVIEREEGLRNWIEAGVLLDALVRYDLLLAIFHPKSPLHDGAVILQDGRLKAAACMLPLTANPRLSREFGSRHRAAIGITEETDAVAVVVSEERGTISFVAEGEMRRFLTASDLRECLVEALRGAPPAEPAAAEAEDPASPSPEPAEGPAGEVVR